MKKKTVLVGMSGGMDSSIAVLLLQKKDYNVIGVTLQLFENETNKQLENVISRLGIEHYYLDIRKDFRNIVIKYFINEYKSGRTPSPCFYCNEKIKFPVFINAAEKIGIKFIATGHYVNKVFVKGKYYISKGRDKSKDQSYYLWRLNQEALKKALFPLGEKNKNEVKSLALKYGLEALAKQKESMGVCFLKNMKYKDYLLAYVPEIFEKIGKGKVLDLKGNEIGEHDGYPFYTIGQKEGISINKKGSFYVRKIDTEKNILYVDQKSTLFCNNLEVHHFYFHDINDIKSKNIKVIVRGIGDNPEGFCLIRIINKNRAIVKLDHPVWAIAPGQPVVFYINERVIGGGIADNN